MRTQESTEHPKEQRFRINNKIFIVRYPAEASRDVANEIMARAFARIFSKETNTRLIMRDAVDMYSEYVITKGK